MTAKPLHAEVSAAAAVLGAILAFPDAPETREALDRLGADHLEDSRHRVVLEAICTVAARGDLPDLVAVLDTLRAGGRLAAAGGDLTVTALLDAAPAIPALTCQHLDVLDEVAARTRALRLARELAYGARRDPAAALARAQQELAAGPVPGRGGGVLVNLRDVVPRKVRWLWPARVPLGKVTQFDGDPDLGKSTVLLDLAARVTTARPMPDGARGDFGGARGVVVLSAEDDPADTIRPRLDAAGADVERVVVLLGVRDARGLRGPTIADLDALRQAVRAVDAVLVIVDPLMAHLPDARDAHRDQDVRRALAPLAAFAAETGAAVAAVRHLNKNGGVAGSAPLYRGAGSIGIIGAARAGLLVAADPDDPTGERRVLAVVKSNLAAKAPSLAYRLVPTAGAVRVAWEGPTPHTAAALLAAAVSAEDRPALDEATAFLREALASGPRPAAEVKIAAKEAGIAERTLERARLRAGILTRKEGFAGAPWVWMPPFSPRPNTLQVGENGAFGENAALPAFQPPPFSPPAHSRHDDGVGGFDSEDRADE